MALLKAVQMVAQRVAMTVAQLAVRRVAWLAAMMADMTAVSTVD